MKTFTSFHELDALGEGLSKDYISRTHRWNARCFDIEGFITDYLGLHIIYESFACLLHNKSTESCKAKMEKVASPFWRKLQAAYPVS